IESILAALKQALTRCRGPEEIWMARDLKRAIVLVDGLDEDAAKEILDQEGVWAPAVPAGRVSEEGTEEPQQSAENDNRCSARASWPLNNSSFLTFSAGAPYTPATRRKPTSAEDHLHEHTGDLAGSSLFSHRSDCGVLPDTLYRSHRG